VSVRHPTDLPADAVLPVRHPDAPPPGEELLSHYRFCYGCGIDHPTGLHLRVVAGEGLSIRAEFDVTEHHQGAPGLAHGGVLAAAFDESLGALNWLLRHPAVTVRLETDFRRPVPVGSRLHIRAEVVGQSGRKVYTRASGRLAPDDAQPAVEAAALFVQVPLEHFRAHGRADDVDRAAADVASGVTRSYEVNP